MTEKVVVITGASSGIGEATALLLAKQKYTLVLASRNHVALEAVARKCKAEGGRTLTLTADIAKAEDVNRIAETTVEHFGRIDAWINNASVIFYGRFLDTKPEEFRQVIETNLFGAIYGSRAALSQFKSQGYGTLINISSGLGAIPAPYVSAYVSSKAAVRGLTASLLQELYADNIKDIHVCGVLPATIDTPIYQHSGSRMEYKPRTIPPVYSVDKAARKIARLIDHPKSEITIGSVVRFGNIFYALFPAVFLRAFAWYTRKFASMSEPGSPRSGNLFEPQKDGSTVGGWKRNDGVSTNEKESQQ